MTTWAWEGRELPPQPASGNAVSNNTTDVSRPSSVNERPQITRTFLSDALSDAPRDNHQFDAPTLSARKNSDDSRNGIRATRAVPVSSGELLNAVREPDDA